MIGSDGIYYSQFDKSYTFKTKKDALIDIRVSSLDSREKARVKRFANGEYIYTPKCSGERENGKFFKIVRITKNNLCHYKKWIEEQESRKENLCLW